MVALGRISTFLRADEVAVPYTIEPASDVAIDVDGRPVATMGPGDGIGEIALLREVPRTATATAITAVAGYVLDARDFLGAVCGPASASAARAVVEERLAR